MLLRIKNTLLSLALVFAVQTYAHAAAISWDSGGGDANWYTPANWSGDVVPTFTDDVTLDINTTVTVDASSPPIGFSSLVIGGANNTTLHLSTGFINSNGALTIKVGSTLIQNHANTLGFGSITMESGSSIRHSSNSATKQFVVDFSVIGNMTIQASALINVSSMGYAGGDSGSPGVAGSGPGAGSGGASPAAAGGAGGGFGGLGGVGGDAILPVGGSINGSFSNPVQLGSGGGGAEDSVVSTARGGAGGGAVRLAVGGTFTFNGIINASGASGSAGAGADTTLGAGGGGSGGSINITAQNLSGSGSLHVDGGSGGADADGGDDPGAGGGGGRIAIVVTGSDSSNYKISASPGAGGAGGASRNGGVGTIAIRRAGASRYDLLLGAVGSVTPESTTTISGVTISSAIVRGDVLLHLPPSSVISGSMTVNSGAVLTMATTDALTIGGDAILRAGSTVTHEANGISQVFEVDWDVTGDMVIEAGASLDVSSRGYNSGSVCGAGAGPGGGAAGTSGGGGGAYGGDGGAGNAGTHAGGTGYGSASNPVNMGSQGGDGEGCTVGVDGMGGVGGGLAILNVGGSLTIDGVIRANGDAGLDDGGVSQSAGGGGAGGGVNITAGSLLGSGRIAAAGGAGGAAGSAGGGGSGGRIAISVSGAINTTFSSMTVTGGAAGDGTAFAGSSGSVPSGPSAITDLAVSAIVSTGFAASSTVVTLTWSAPATGIAGGSNALYEIRYDVNPIVTQTEYNLAPFSVVVTTTIVPGAAESVQIQSLDPSATIYFAVSAKDGLALQAGLSNGATAPAYLVVIPDTDIGSIRGAAWGDYDGDGDLDFAVANDASNVYVMRNNNNGTYTRFDTAQSDMRSVSWGDFDKDGDLDLAAGGDVGVNHVILRNDGANTFTATALLPANTDSRGLVWGDFNNDGYLDLYVPGFAATDYIAQSNEGLSFSTFGVAGTVSNARSAAWGDYDNDGDLDVLVGANDVDAFIVKNNGDGSVSTFTIAGTGNATLGVAWADADGDGDLDAMLAKNGSNQIYMQNNGADSFSTFAVSGSNVTAQDVVAGDFDNDGDVDFVIGSNGNKTLLLENDGAASFTAKTFPGSNLGAVEDLAVADADSDGDLDLAWVLGGSEVRLVRNDISIAHTLPTPPSGGFSETFTEFSVGSSSGFLSLRWNPGSDAQTTDTDLLEYFVRVGTTPGGSEIVRIPDRFSVSGHGGSAAPYSTRLSPSQRGIKLLLQKETTTYWSVLTMDSEFNRGTTTSERFAALSAPGSITDLSAAFVSTGLGASTMTVTLTWTAPGDNGTTDTITGGNYDIRYSTISPMTSFSEYAAANFQVQVATTVNPGELQSYVIDFLDARATHYFLITTQDSFGVRSELSNPTSAPAYIIVLPSTIQNARDVAWGDLDGDGDLDLAIANDSNQNEKVQRLEADGTYTEIDIGGSSLNTQSIAWGDFDNDGDLDLAAANSGTGNETILRNVGNAGTFSLQVLTGSVGDTYGVAWGDYDRDGDLDLAFANGSSQDDYIATNNGDGTFSTFTLTGTGGSSTGVAWGDYDNDGDLDLVIANDGNVDDKLVTNNGDGTFSVAAIAGSGGQSMAIAWGDYDGDGLLDLAVAITGSVSHLLHNDGGGAFTKVPLTGAIGSASGIAWGDFDNDGDLDLFLSYDLGENEIVMINTDGAGTFVKTTLTGSGGASFSISAGDMDGDGDLDVVMGRDNEDQAIFRNDIVVAHSTPTAPTGFSASFSEYSEFSSSGILTMMWDPGTDAETTDSDLLEYFVRIGTTVAGSSTTYKFPNRFGVSGKNGGYLYSTRASTAAGKRGIQVIMQDETTSYWSIMTVDSELSRSSPSAEQTTFVVAPAAVSDLAVSVILSTAIGASSMTVRLSWSAPGDDGPAGNIIDGEFEIRYSSISSILTENDFINAAPEFRIVIATSVSPGQPQAYDIPFLDAATTYYFAITTKDGLGIRSGLSNPATAETYIREIAGTGGDTYSAAWADFDNDGDLDFVASNYSGNKVKAVNNGDGTFTQSAIAGTGEASRALAWGDLDNDGDLDAVLANFGQDQTILVNDGSGGFTNTTLTNSGGDSQGVAIGDFDNDGDLDFVTSENALNTVILHTNYGGLSFSTSAITGGGVNSRGIAAGDINNDGLLDIVVANHFDEDVKILENLGGGIFSQNQLSGTSGRSNGVALGDYDGDGDLDIAISNSGNTDAGEVNYVLRNDDGTNFTKTPFNAFVQASYGVSWADVNNDGRLDVAYANYSGGDEVVMINTGGDVFKGHRLHNSTGIARSVSWGDYDDDGDLDLLLGNRDGLMEYVLRNDTATLNNAPSAPAGLSASYSPYSVFSTSGTLSLMWNDSTDTESTSASLNYFVRIGTTVAGSSTTMRIPRRYSGDGNAGEGFLYSTRLSNSQRGFQFEMQNETTVYWSVVAEDGGRVRSSDSGEFTTDLSVPEAMDDLAAVIDPAIQTSSVAWVKLNFTAPGENGPNGNLQAGAFFDIRWSTAGPINTNAKYEFAAHKTTVAANGTTAGAAASRSVSVDDPTKTYYFAVTTVDQFGARSARSNSTSGLQLNIMREEITDIGGGNVLQGTTTGFLRLRVWTDAGSVQWSRLRVRKIGTLPDGAVAIVGIWNDNANLNNVFDSADEPNRVTTNTTFVSSAAVLTFGSAQTINTSTKTYFVGVEIDPVFLPVSGATMSMIIDGEGFVVSQGAIAMVDFPAMHFDGIDDGAVAPFHASLNLGAFTMEAWVKTGDTGADRVIISRGDSTSGPRLWLNGSGCGGGVPTFYVGADFLCANQSGTPVTISDGEWHHVAVAYNVTNGKKIFVDGLGLSTGSTSGTPFNVTAGIGIGHSTAALGGIGNVLNGEIDEVRILDFSTEYSTATEFSPSRRFADNNGPTVLLYHFDASLEATTEVEDDSDLVNTKGGSLVGTVGGYGRSTFTAVVDNQDVFVSLGVDVAPSTMFQNEKNIAMLRLDLWTEGDLATLDSFFVTPTGNGSGSENLSFYRDNGDKLFNSASDAMLINGVSFLIGTATFNLSGVGAEQLISPTTQTFFVVWDMGASASLNKTLGLQMATTSNFTLAGSTDVVFNAGFPILTSQPSIVAADVFVTAESATGTWINVSSVVFRTDFNKGNVDHYHYVWDQLPGTSASEPDLVWSGGKSTQTATVDANDWYFHVRAFAIDPVSGTQKNFGPFFIDQTAPTGSGFLTYTSTQGPINETQFSDLSSDVTASFRIQDALSGINVNGPAPVAPDSGTVSLWHFDEQSGAAWLDASGPNRNDLSIGAGSVSRTHGRFKTGILFDGVGYLIDPSPKFLPIGNSERAFSAWIFVNSTMTTQGISSWGNGVGRMRIGLVGGQLAVDMGSGYVARGLVVSTGVWQHVAFTFDGNMGRYYLDGVEGGNNAFGAQSTVAGAIYVGQADDGVRFTGAVDDVRILDRALTAGEVLADFSRGDPYYVAYSTNAGKTWQFVASTDTAQNEHMQLNASHGSLAQETVKVFGMDLSISTSTQIGALSTNQVLFYTADVAGNVLTSGPFAVLSDTNAAVAISTGILPVSGSGVASNGTLPNFNWIGPAPGIVSGLNGEFILEVAENDTTFATPDIRISTPATAPDFGLASVNAAYISTFTLNAGSTYYWRVRALSSLGVFSPWSQTASFVTDVTTPSISSFRVFNSSNGAFLESENIDLLSGVTAQITVEDATGGPAGLSYFAQYPSTPNVLGYWNFDETFGSSPHDGSGNGNDGTLACGTIACSSPTYAASRFGSGMKCAGGQGMTAPSANLKVPSGSSMTLEAWILPTTVSSIRVIAGIGTPLSAGRNYTLSIVSGDLQFNTEGGSFTGTDDAIKANTWQHVAAVVEGFRVSLYINGVLDSFGTLGVGVSDAETIPFSVCAGLNSSNVWSGFFSGMIDEVRVIGRALDAKQIAENYDATRRGRFAVEYSTNSGQVWNVVSATYPVSGFPYLNVTGTHGSIGQEDLQVRHLDLTHSTSNLTGSLGTNLLRMTVPDRAGNILTSNPFSIIIDTVAAASVATPLFLADTVHVGRNPNFAWTGPSSATIVQMGAGSTYILEVDSVENFAAPVISISTPVITQSTTTSIVHGLYVSTFSLLDDTTYYWRVRTQNSLGLRSPPLSVFRFITDFDSATASGFITRSSTGGAFGEALANDLALGVTAEVRIQDAFPNAGLSTSPVNGITPFGVMYTTQGAATLPFWIDGGWASAFRDPSETAVEVLESYQGDLYAGTRGGVNSPVFRFTGFAWVSVGAPLPGAAVKAFAVFNGKLYAGLEGDGRIYSWNGSVWTMEFNTGQTDVNALLVYNGRLHAATSGNAEIWAFDATSATWYRAFTAPIDPLNALAEFNGSLYVAGQGGVYVANGSSLTISNNVNVNFPSLAVYDNALYAGSNDSGKVYAFNGTTWSVDYPSTELSVDSLGVHDGRLYAGIGGPSPGRIYSKDGKDWLLVRQMPSASDDILTFKHFNGRLYAGTRLASGGDVFVSTPIAVTLTGSDGSTALETLRAERLDFAQSGNSNVCLGVSGCTASNQVRFTATDRAGNASAAGPYAVLIDTLISQPTATFPASGEFVMRAQPNLLWKEATLQPTHDLQVSANANMSSPLFAPINTAGGVFQVPTPLADGTTYYWWVRSLNALGIPTEFTPQNNFIVDLTPPTPGAFSHINSTGGIINEAQMNNFAPGTTVQITLQDLTAGLITTTMTAPGSQQFASGGFGLEYSTNAGVSWRSVSPAVVSQDGAQESILSLASFNGSLYAGQGTGMGDGDVFFYNGTSWAATSALPGAAGIEAVHALAVYNGKLYAGLGSSAGDGDVAAFNGTWSLSFDGAVNSIRALAVYNGDLYAAEGGVAAGDGDIQVFDGTSWSLSTGTAEVEIRSLAVYQNRLYAGGGTSGLRSFDGKAWTTDAAASADSIISLAVYNGLLYAGTTGGDVRVFDGTAWATSFTGAQEEILSLAVFNGRLYAGQGVDTAGDGDIYVFDSQTWRLAYDGATEGVFSLAVFNGSLFAGQGNATGNGDVLAMASLPGSSLSGFDGTLGVETLLAHLDLESSTNTSVCGGVAPCDATNQVRFSATDRAGNVMVDGPYAVIVDSWVPQPTSMSLTPQTTESIFVTAIASDNLAGIQDYLFEASTSAVFNPPITASSFVTVDSYTFTNLLIATTYYFRVTLRDTQLNVSTPSVILSTSTFGTVFYSSAAAAPASALQNAIVPMLRMHLRTPGLSSTFEDLKVTLTGSATNQDVGQAQIYRDANGNGTFDAGAETFLGGAPVSNGVANIVLGGNAQTIGVQISTFFVAYQMSAFATVGNTIGMDIVAAGDLGLQHPDSAEGPFPTSIAPISITDGANTLTLDPDGAAVPAQNAAPGAFNVLVKRLDATTPVGTSLLNELVIHMTGDLDPNEITRINVWRDRETPGVFDPGNTANEDKLTDQAQIFTAKGPGVSVSTVVLSAIASSRTVVQGGGEFFYITVDLSATAQQGKGFQLVIASTEDVRLNNSSDDVAFTVSPIETSTVTVQINNNVFIATRALTASTFLQGQTYAVLATTITVDLGTADIDRVKVNLNGTAGDSDIEKVEIYRDKDNDGPPFLGPGVDIRLGSATFSGGQAFVNISPPLQVSASTTVLYVVYTISANATGGNTVGAVITDAQDFRTVDPTSFVQGPFPVSTSLVPIEETINTLLIPSVPSVNPPNIKQGAKNVTLLSLELQSDNNDIIWSSLTLDRLGDTADADVEAVRIYRTSVSAENQLSGTISTDTFTGGSVTVALDAGESISSAAVSYVVAMDISPNAVPGSSIAVRVATTSAIAIDAPNLVSSQTASFPIITPIYVPVQQFDNTVVVTTASITPVLGALPGTLDVGIMHLKMNTDVSTAKLQSLRVERVGSSVNGDVDSVKIYFDKTGGGVWDSSNLSAYDLISSTTQTFGDSGPNDVVINFSTPPVLFPASNPNGQKGFFVVIDISTMATPDNTLIIRANNDTFFAVDNPNRIDSNAKFTAGTLRIAAPPSLMFVVATDTAPAQIVQGQIGTPMLKLEAWMENFTGKWSQLTVSRSGTGFDGDVSGVRLFDDSGSVSGDFDAGDAELTASAGVFSGGVAALNFSTQTITSSTRTFYLVCDIHVAAQGTNVGVQVNNSGDFVLAPPHVTSNLGFPLQSSNSNILKTQTGMQVLGFPRAAGQLFQGAVDQPIISLQMNTTQLALLFSAVTVRSTGTAADSDISAVNLWFDANGNNNFESGIDQKLTAGTERFIGGLAALTLLPGSEQTIKTTQKNYFVTVDVAPFADESKTFGLVVESSSAFVVSSPNFVVNSNFPAPSSPPISQLRKINEVLNILPTDVAPAGGVNQSTEAVMMRLDVSANRNNVEWTKINIDKLGTLAVSSITAIRVYRSTAAGAFVADPSLIIGSGTVAASQASIVFASSQTIGVTTQTYYVSAEIDIGARTGDTLGLKISGAGSLTVTKGDSVSNANLPLSTLLVSVLDSRTPTKPIVTPTDGSFSSNFEFLGFNWNSTVTLGTLIGAEYAIGTTPGGNDVFPGGANPAVFAPISAGQTNVEAKGFALISGNTYYVSVRTQSQVSPDPTVFVSPVGISQPLLMDFTIPAAPAPNISQSGQTLLLTWGTVSAGPSGILGYLVEFRTGEVPLWKNAKTGAKATAQTVSSLSPQASVPASDVVIGNSFQVANLPSGTIYVRMRAVTGAGQAGPASEPVKLLLGNARDEGITDVSNYPNPFDSRKEKTIIHFGMGSAGEATVTIFSIYGRRIKSINVNGAAGSNEVVWDGTDEGGTKVSKGMYLAVIEGGGSKIVHKIGVIH